jgi:voltage-gated potassium channel Kch
MTTVGYGDIYPVTPEGRIAGVILMVLGISLFSAVTAVITSFLLATGSSAPKAADAGLVPELERLTTLWTRGALDDGEFSAAKARLLS